jgi:hypothetical protein
MSKFNIEDLRFSSSSIDDFFKSPEPRVHTSSTVGKVRVSGLHELAGFSFIAEDKLVRTSKQDFWQLGQDDDGYFIERLVSDDDGPIKEEE